MAVTGHVFQQWPLGVAEKLQSLNGVDTLKMALGNAAGPITQATTGIQAAKLFTDWTAIVAEITGTGYTAGGVGLTGVTAAVATNVMTLTASSSPQWTSASFTANQAVLYDSTASTIQLIAFWDFGGAITVTASTFIATINGSGLLTNTAS